MTERPFPEPNLEASLLDLGTQIAFPTTPDVAASVRRRLEARLAPPLPWWRTVLAPRRLALGALILALLVAAVLALSPEARQAVADRLGVRGLDIRQVPVLPTLPPTPSPEPSATVA